jgi:hypothetical protein
MHNYKVCLLPGRMGVMGQVAGQQHATAAALDARRQTEPRRSAELLGREGKRLMSINRESTFGEA